MSSTASPSTTWPRPSTRITRSPSPSNATPSRQLTSDRGGRHVRRMRRTARQVDVATVRTVSRARRRRSPGARTGAARSSSSRRSPCRRPGALRRADPADGISLCDVIQIGVGERRVRAHAAARRHRPSTRWSATRRFDARLFGLAEFLAAAGEHLDAVVAVRVVRGREHDAEVDVERAGEIGDRRRRARRRRSRRRRRRP